MKKLPSGDHVETLTEIDHSTGSSLSRGLSPSGSLEHQEENDVGIRSIAWTDRRAQLVLGPRSYRCRGLFRDSASRNR